MATVSDCMTWVECGPVMFVNTMVIFYTQTTEGIIAGLICLLAGLASRRWWIAAAVGVVVGAVAFAILLKRTMDLGDDTGIAAAMTGLLAAPMVAGATIASLLGWLILCAWWRGRARYVSRG